MGLQVTHFVDSQLRGNTLLDIAIVGDVSDALTSEDFCAFIAIGDNDKRAFVHDRLVGGFPRISFPALTHPSSVVSYHARLGQGTILMPNAVVGPNTIVGDFCIVNTGATIDHDSEMKNYSSLAPGVTTGGRVSVGARTAISIGAVLKHGVTVGDDCVVGAHSYLNSSLEHNRLAYGSPARVVRYRERGDPYL